MIIIKPVTYTILIILWLTLIFSTVDAFATTQHNVSGANTSTEITGGYTGGATTYESGSTSSTTSTNSSTSNIKSAPYTASAPGMNTSNNCAMALSGGLQTFSIGVSGGKSYVDKTCELIALSTALRNSGMKVASISILCSDPRVWRAMYFSATYCPTPSGKIGQAAKEEIDNLYNGEMPTYKKYVELQNKKNKAPKAIKIHNDKKD